MKWPKACKSDHIILWFQSLQWFRSTLKIKSRFLTVTCQVLHDQIFACLLNVISTMLSLCVLLSSHADLISLKHTVPLLLCMLCPIPGMLSP